MRRLLLFIFLAWSVAVVGGGVVRSQAQSSPEPDIVRRAQMRGHYQAATQVYEAAIRGDLTAAREAAIALWGLPVPEGLSPTAAAVAEQVKIAGRSVADATTLGEVAAGSANLLALCGDCHQASGVRVAPIVADRPDVGGVVGHMLAHQQAVEALVEGLVAPSASRWNAGADQLRIAPLRPEALPSDPGLSDEVRAAESQVHDLAEMAGAAGDRTARTVAFARLVVTCSSCHRLHAGTWGPRSDVR